MELFEDVLRGLVAAARENGADPIDWPGTFDPVPRTDWMAVERYVDGTWVAELLLDRLHAE